MLTNQNKILNYYCDQVYKEQTEFFNSEDYEFNGDTAVWKNKDDSNTTSLFIELVTSPNNPDGEMRNAVLRGPSVKKVHDLAYYWPHFTPIPHPADQDLMIFTLSKLTGHAGSRFGYATNSSNQITDLVSKTLRLSQFDP